MQRGNLMAAQAQIQGGALGQVRPQSETESEFEQLTKAVYEVADVVGALLDRINPVLMPEHLGNTQAGAGVPHAVLSPLAEQIRNERQRIEALTGRVRGVSSRLAI